MAKKSGITWKTKKAHVQKWSEATERINAMLSSKEDPEHYFVRNSNAFDSYSLTSKSHEVLFTSQSGISVKQFYLDIASELLFIASHWCDEAEEYMQSHHKWKNRTGDAERGLFATIAGMEEDKIVMMLYHSVPYGVYLETRDFPIAGNLEIIRPTLLIFSPRLTRDLQGFIDRM